MPNTRTIRQGVAYGVGAYGIWGLIPLYFKSVAHVAPVEIVAYRTLWSLAILVALVLVLGKGRDLLRELCDRKILGMLAVSTLLIGSNWLLYVHTVTSGQVLQAALAYFANPLVSVLLGVVLLGERLRPMQLAAIVLAGAGMLVLGIKVGQFPWLALSLALTFAFYGLMRKLVPVDSLVSLSAETLMLAPFAAAYLVWIWTRPEYVGHDLRTNLLLPFSGAVTAVPLLMFGAAMRRLPLSTMGILQYLSPSLLFLLAVVVFGEPLMYDRLVSFALVWTAVAIYLADGFRARRAVAIEVIEPD